MSSCRLQLNQADIETTLKRLADVEALAKAVIKKHAKLDVLINNAGN